MAEGEVEMESDHSPPPGVMDEGREQTQTQQLEEMQPDHEAGSDFNATGTLPTPTGPRVQQTGGTFGSMVFHGGATVTVGGNFAPTVHNNNPGGDKGGNGSSGSSLSCDADRRPTRDLP
eukprot:3940368-Rhodomonas_salina.2